MNAQRQHNNTPLLAAASTDEINGTILLQLSLTSTTHYYSPTECDRACASRSGTTVYVPAFRKYKIYHHHNDSLENRSSHRLEHLQAIPPDNKFSCPTRIGVSSATSVRVVGCMRTAVSHHRGRVRCSLPQNEINTNVPSSAHRVLVCLHHKVLSKYPPPTNAFVLLLGRMLVRVPHCRRATKCNDEHVRQLRRVRAAQQCSAISVRCPDCIVLVDYMRVQDLEGMRRIWKQMNTFEGLDVF